MNKFYLKNKEQKIEILINRGKKLGDKLFWPIPINDKH